MSKIGLPPELESEFVRTDPFQAMLLRLLIVRELQAEFDAEKAQEAARARSDGDQANRVIEKGIQLPGSGQLLVVHESEAGTIFADQPSDRRVVLSNTTGGLGRTEKIATSGVGNDTIVPELKEPGLVTVLWTTAQGYLLVAKKAGELVEELKEKLNAPMDVLPEYSNLGVESMGHEGDTREIPTWLIRLAVVELLSEMPGKKDLNIPADGVIKLVSHTANELPVSSGIAELLGSKDGVLVAHYTTGSLAATDLKMEIDDKEPGRVVTVRFDDPKAYRGFAERIRTITERLQKKLQETT